MCEPISLSIGGVMSAIAVATSALSTGLGVISSIQQGKAQKAQYDYQAAVERQNAKIANQNAARERQQGIEESRLQRLKAQQNVASQTSAMAANGIDVTQGTPVDVLGDTAMWGEMDALNILANSESRAQAFEQQASNFRNQSRLDSLAGQNAYKAGQINAISSGLNGISSTMNVADKWYGFSGNSTDANLKINKSFKNRVAMNTLA